MYQRQINSMGKHFNLFLFKLMVCSLCPVEIWHKQSPVAWQPCTLLQCEWSGSNRFNPLMELFVAVESMLGSKLEGTFEL